METSEKLLDFILRACREDEISFNSRFPLDRLGVARIIKEPFSKVLNDKLSSNRKVQN
jgi:hypothetical protein